METLTRGTSSFLIAGWSRGICVCVSVEHGARTPFMLATLSPEDALAASGKVCSLIVMCRVCDDDYDAVLGAVFL